MTEKSVNDSTEIGRNIRIGIKTVEELKKYTLYSNSYFNYVLIVR